jgi:hypothetical protein
MKYYPSIEILTSQVNAKGFDVHIPVFGLCLMQMVFSLSVTYSV